MPVHRFTFLICATIPALAASHTEPSGWQIPTGLGLSVLLAAILVIWSTVRRRRQKREMAAALDSSRIELATTILHNIGNILNSLRVSCDQSERMLRAVRIQQLIRATEMIDEHRDDLAYYLTEDPRGKLIPDYLLGSTRVLAEEVAEVLSELEEMGEKINLMKDIIETQQSQAKLTSDKEAHDLHRIVGDALEVQADALKRRGIEVHTAYGETRLIRAHRTQVMHILINLIKNALEALEQAVDRDRLLAIETRQLDDRAELTIRDNGCGISPEDMKELFSYGFTTKESGHGFGLHYCYRAMRDLGGSIAVESDGKDKGACFRLSFPTIAIAGEQV